jgi:hypothetical protein
MALSQDIEQQIKVFVVNGLTQPEIEAVIGRKLDKEESEFCKKCRTIHRLREKKRISEKHLHKQSGYDAVMKHRDKYSSIDDQMEKALKEIDWERRNRAEKSLCAWVDTYMCSGVALNDPPS